MNLSYNTTTNIDVYFIEEVNDKTDIVVDTLAITCNHDKAESYAKSLNAEQSCDNRYVVVQSSMNIERYRDIQVGKSKMCECIDEYEDQADVRRYLGDDKIGIKGLPEDYRKYNYLIAMYNYVEKAYWYYEGFYLRSEVYSYAIDLNFDDFIYMVFRVDDVKSIP